MPPALRLVHAAKLAVHRAGFDVRRETFKRHFVHSLHAHDITTVIDVGANRGQFALALRRAGFTGRVISLEPLGDAFGALEAAAADDRRWIVRRAAVAERTGSLTVNVSANSVSSSVLPMLDRHTDAAPGSRYVATEQVPSVTIDQLVTDHQVVVSRTMLKIDVQGYESQVLDGAVTTLESVAGVRTEMSLAPLYDGQTLMSELMVRLERCGLDLWSLDPGFVEPGTGRLLQTDGVFYRSPEVPDGQ